MVRGFVLLFLEENATKNLFGPAGLFAHAVTKLAQAAAKRQIIPVGVDDQLGTVEAEAAGFIEEALVHIDGDDLRQKDS